MAHVLSYSVVCNVLSLTLNARVRQQISLLPHAERELVMEMAESAAVTGFTAAIDGPGSVSDDPNGSRFLLTLTLANLYRNTRYPTFRAVDSLYREQYGESINAHDDLCKVGEEHWFSAAFYKGCIDTMGVAIFLQHHYPDSSEEETARYERIALVNTRLLSLAQAIRQADLILPTLAESLT